MSAEVKALSVLVALVVIVSTIFSSVDFFIEVLVFLTSPILNMELMPPVLVVLIGWTVLIVIAVTPSGLVKVRTPSA